MPTMTQRAASFWLLMLAVPSFGQLSSSSADAGRGSITSDALLRRAHAMLPSLTLLDRRMVLSDLISCASERKKHARDTVAWVDEAFALASQAPSRRGRINDQIGAIQALSSVDSMAALDRLQLIEGPLHPGDDDPRDAGAQFVFDQFAQHHPDEIGKIIPVVRHLSGTGRYPYGGVTNLLTRMSARDAGSPPSKEYREVARVLVTEAIRNFEASPDTDTESFCSFIRGKSQFVAPDLLKPALQELVERLLRPPAQKTIALIADRNDDQPIISNRNHLLLAELMLTIRSVDPDWEQQLRQDPDVNRVVEKLEHGMGLWAQYTYTKGKSDEGAMQYLQAQRADWLAGSWPKKPEKAERALDEVSDPLKHAWAATLMAIKLRDSQPEYSAQLLAGVQETLANTKAPHDRLAILRSLAQALAVMERREQLTAVVDQSFAAADDIISAAAGSGWPYELPFIVEFSARVIPQHTLDKTSQVRVPVLQARLLIAMAEGVDQEEDRTKSRSAVRTAGSGSKE